MSPILAAATAATGVTPSGIAGANHDLNEKYFDRISAMEFAVLYDDGKDPKGFLEADIVLLGVSRTSKTPLSLFLANRNLKVANLPWFRTRTFQTKSTKSIRRKLSVSPPTPRS